MGEKRNRRKAQKALALTIALLIGCAFRGQLGVPYTLYYGKFVAFDASGKTVSGTWEAVCTNGVITRVYLYNSMGFPAAALEVEGKRIKTKRRLSEGLKRAIAALAARLPSLYANRCAKEEIEGILIEKHGSIITLSGERGMVKIKVEGSRRVNPSPSPVNSPSEEGLY